MGLWHDNSYLVRIIRLSVSRPLEGISISMNEIEILLRFLLLSACFRFVYRYEVFGSLSSSSNFLNFLLTSSAPHLEASHRLMKSYTTLNKIELIVDILQTNISTIFIHL